MTGNGNKRFLTASEIRRLAEGSTRYEMHNGVMRVQSYYEDREIWLDLRKLTPEILEELAPDEEDDEDDENWDE